MAKRSLSWLLLPAAIFAACTTSTPGIILPDAGSQSLPPFDAGPDGLCAVGALQCGVNASCIDNPSRCVCNPGYSGDGQICTLVDECADGGGADCDPNAACANVVIQLEADASPGIQIGSYTCQCNPGYTGDGRVCTLEDLCSMADAGCDPNAQCSQDGGTTSCTCNPGFTGDGGLCTVVPACETLDASNCDPNAKCTDLSQGGYLCTCNAGYQGDGFTCTPVNPCIDGELTCGTNATCAATDGSYGCACLPGFTGDGMTCTDIDECTNGTAQCPQGATCINTPGSYVCQCPPGYTSTDGGMDCAPENLCLIGSSPCGAHAICTPSPGTYTCTCEPGYEGDGVTCEDVDECGDGTATCSPDATCTNTPGSYTCTCNFGYSGNGVTCALINECAPNPCDANATCASEVGTYACTCNQGWMGNGITCTDVDECTNGTADCSPDAYCTNTPGSYTCTCDPGYTGSGKTCTVVNECQNAGCGGLSTCENVPGGYYCECPPGDEGGAACHTLRKQIAAGDTYGCSINTGVLACWGTSTVGGLGLGATTHTVNRTQVDTSDWLDVVSSPTHSCAIRNDHSLWCWGEPDDTGTEYTTPTQVGTAFTWEDISVGSHFSCGIQSAGGNAGTLWCWGRNQDGQVGDSTTIDSTTPEQIGSSNKWEVVAAGDHHACGIAAGELWCWGGNEAGQVGVPGLPSIDQPTLVSMTQVHWATLRAGYQHTCGTDDASNLWCWGDNTYGQLGTGTGSSATSPQQVGTGLKWSVVATGVSHTCALQGNATLWCWGDNSFGELGIGTIVSSSTPVAVTAGTTWSEVAAGTQFTCATRSTGVSDCWGTNDGARLGLGVDSNQDAPVHVAGGHLWLQLAAGPQSACGILANGSLWCWGANTTGQLGTGTLQPQQQPVQIGASGFLWQQVAVGNGYACAVGQDGSLWCWGDNSYGEMGVTPSTTPTLKPVEVGTLKTWFAVAAGASHVCAIETDAMSNNDLWCWGRDDSGQVGNGMTEKSAPVTEIASTTSWALVAAGDAHTCAVDSGGGLSCWGSNSAGQAGGITSANITTPTPIPAASIPGWSTIFLGTGMTCAIATTMNSDMYCLGNNTVGQLGIGDTTSTSTPTLLVSPDPEVTWNWDSQEVIGQQTFAGSAADTHACAIQTDGSLWCWGEDLNGEFGNGVTPPLTPTPVTVPELGPQTGEWAGVAAGHDFTCGLQEETTGNAAFCFGLNDIGQLGDGLAWYETPSQQP